MRKEIRRKDKEVSRTEAFEILEKGHLGTLAVNGEEGYPYSVPVNYCMDGENILFHSAMAGYKFDAMKKDPKVSFSVVLTEEIIQEVFTSTYESAVVFGKVKFIEDEAEKKEKLMILVKRHHGNFVEKGQEYVDKAVAETAVIEIIPEHVSGKRGVV